MISKFVRPKNSASKAAEAATPEEWVAVKRERKSMIFLKSSDIEQILEIFISIF
jgi:hypothetical protein